MTDTTTIGAVTLTAKGGGVYLLSHPSLPTAETVRGKEAAEARAAELNLRNALSESLDTGSMGEQSLQGLEAVSDQINDLVEAAKPNVSTGAQTPLGLTDSDSTMSAQLRVAELQAQNKELLERVSQLEVSTVAPEVAAAVKIPARFDNASQQATEELLDRAGVVSARIVLEENENIPPTGQFVAHNGRSYVIVPGEEVTVPEFLLEVLDNAQMASAIVDSKSQKVLGYRTRSRFPYRRL